MEKKNFFPEPDIKLLSPHSLQNEYDYDHFRELSTSGLSSIKTQFRIGRRQSEINPPAPTWGSV